MRDYLTPWTAAKAEKQFLARFAGCCYALSVGAVRNPAGVTAHAPLPTLRSRIIATTRRTAMIHVCSLAALPDTVKATGASHVLTVMANVAQVQRPESVLEANHLRVSDGRHHRADGRLSRAVG